jgi:hypothetical protein
MTSYGLSVFDQHAQMLAGSGITPEHARARGYVSVDTKARLEGIGVTKTGRKIPGLLVPSLRKDGSVWGYQYRPDTPRLRDGKPVKYETPTKQRNGIDVPPGVGPKLNDPTIPLWVTEGVKKADSAAVAGLCCVALPGVWSWRGTNDKGGKTAVADWHDVALNSRRVVLAFDSDVVRKRSVRTALDQLAGYLVSKGARVEYLHLPDDDQAKTGLDDYLVDDHKPGDLWRLVKPEPPAVDNSSSTTSQTTTPPAPGVAPRPERRSLDEVRAVFRRWLGDEYDLDVLDIVLAVAASEQLSGDPAWLLVVSGSGAAKTETVIPLAGAGALVTSTISSEGALLSATSTRERTKDATGGLLREVGGRGVLVIKDVTSVLSMNRDQRAAVLAAMREIHDGTWIRKVGTDGGKSLAWRGRIVVIGAVTTAWDSAHAVVTSMGDRFLLVRMDSKVGRIRSGRQAIHNTGGEVAMRAELSATVAGLLAHVDRAETNPTETETNILVGLADIVTLARTAVETDPRGDVIDAHAPEMPTRFAKQLTQVMRGAIALGMPRSRALDLAVRCARDSVPPLRLSVLLDVLANPDSTTHAVRVRLDRPRTTIDRVLQGLHMLELVTVAEVEEQQGFKSRTVWRYSLADTLDPDAFTLLGSTGNVSTGTQDTREESQSDDDPPTPSRTPSDISGTTHEPQACRHGMAGGDQPDPWLKGRLACPECAQAAS